MCTCAHTATVYLRRYEVKAPTITSDRVCATKAICDATTQYTSVAATATSDRECAAKTVCPPGTYIKNSGSSFADNDCTKCAIGKFSSTSNSKYCKLQTRCRENFYSTIAVTPSTNTNCTKCPVGKYQPAKLSLAEECTEGTLTTTIPAPTGPTTTAEVRNVTSNGEKTRPYCTWNALPCTWSTKEQDICAAGLCKAAGLPYDAFVTASNNPCTTKLPPAYPRNPSPWHIVFSKGGQGLKQQSFSKYAAVTARCGGAGQQTCGPGQYLSQSSSDVSADCLVCPSGKFQNESASTATTCRPASACPEGFVKVYDATSSSDTVCEPPSTEAPVGTVTVVSDGSRERPYCTWRGVKCVWNASFQDECAERLCAASGRTLVE